ncbi:MAG TPA: HAD family hydrolase [Candidatus Paceibacterota bacterium]|nr:HAD family hydrolase [Candidatus Paceibacterota bacterium]
MLFKSNGYLVAMLNSRFILSALICVQASALTSLCAEDPLPSWNDGAVKQRLQAFVSQVVREGGPDYVAPAERIAVFDNDGTLLCEQPAYPQFLFGMDRMKATASRHSELKDKEPFKSALAGNLEGVIATGVRGLIELTAGTHGGLTTGEFDAVVREWLATARHPRFQRPFHECVYQPMLELLAYLRANGFKTFIVSGGALEFLRPWTEKVYGIPPEQVIGSSVLTRLEVRDGKPVIVRRAEIGLINDHDEKVLSIERVIGRRPILAVGNSDADLPMLQWTGAGSGPRFCAYIHHTDAEREYAYDRQAKTGRLDKGLDEAKARGWAVVDIRRDWNRVFP